MIELNTFRFGGEFQDGVNTCEGLYDLITEVVKPDFKIVEIGCWKGVSSELFALHCEQLYCVDPWVPYNEVSHEDEIQKAENEFDRRMKKYKNVLKLKAKSSDAHNSIKDNTVDLVYIDGDHSYEAVKNDIIFWKPKIKNTGYICGHDYYQHDDSIGVKKAVDEFFPNKIIKIYKDSSWCIHMKETP